MAQAPQQGGGGGSQSVAQQFRGLPVKDMIAAPLAATTDAQIDLANAMIKFVKMLAYEDPSKPGKALTMPMTLQRPVVTEDGTVETNSITVAPPLLGLVPIPALLIDDVQINFSMTVQAHTEDESSKEKEASIDAKASIGFGIWHASATMHGKVTTKSSHKRSTNQEATYDFHVHAGQQPPTEGMSKLMDLLASCVDPIKVEKG